MPASCGIEKLDGPLYDTPATDLPGHRCGPLRPGDNDSGGVLVGAAALVRRTYGHDREPDASRQNFGDVGSANGRQGRGGAVITCGYGRLRGDGSEEFVPPRPVLRQVQKFGRG